jgi:hypothetical protein
MRGDSSPPKPAITSPYAPDLERVRAWMQKKIAAALFVEIIGAILALLGRMRDINLELARKIAHMQRRRPPSETLERLQRQLPLPGFEAPKVKTKRGPRSKDREGHPGRGELPSHLRRLPTTGAARSAAPRCRPSASRAAASISTSSRPSSSSCSPRTRRSAAPTTTPP